MEAKSPSSSAPGLRGLAGILAAMLGSVLAYAGLFGEVLHKPLSGGTIRDYFEIKMARAAALPSPKLVFFGGSNVRYGLSCAVVETEIGVPCVNAGFLADVGIDLMVLKFKPLLNPGDLVYIPLAYEQYLWSSEFVEGRRDAAYLFTYDRTALRQLSLSRQLHALFYFDIPYAASALAENLLAAGGLRRKAGDARVFGAQNLNRFGDETGHAVAQAVDYVEVIARQKLSPPTVAGFEPERYFYTQELEGFLQWAAARDVTVVGGLPQLSNDIDIPDGVIARVRAIYERNGHAFVELPNRSQYPRSCFFDSLYHLAEECQHRHTRDLLPALRPWLEAARYPSRQIPIRTSASEE